jgi:hypothetical protein
MSKRVVIDCTESSPWNHCCPPGAPVRHHGVEEVGEQRDGWPSGDWVTKRCRFCGHEWDEELPQ